MCWLHLKEIGLIDRFADQLVHIIRLVGAWRDKRIKAGLDAVPRIFRRTLWHTSTVILGQIIKEVANRKKRLNIIFERIVGNARLRRVRYRAAKFLLRHHLVGHRFDNVRASDKHIGAVLHHEDEVSYRRAIHRATSAWPHDKADLRDNTARQDVALEHFGIAAERGNTLLNTRAAAVVQTDDRGTDLHGIIKNFADFHGMCFG